MKLKQSITAIVVTLITLSATARDSSTSAKAPQAPDKAKLSYALGTRMGLQFLHATTNLMVNVAVQAVQDVLEGKPTLIQEAEIAPLLNEARSSVLSDQAAKDREKISYAGGMRIALGLKRTGADLDPKVIGEAIHDTLAGKSKMEESEIAPLLMQAQAYEAGKKTSSNKVAGADFLAKNSHEQGVAVLPDGLQYKIIQPGTGLMPTTNDLIFVKFRGTFIDGSEFDHHDHFLTRINGGIRAWQDALARMSVGSKWRLFVPPALAYGADGMPFRGVGPDTTVIYDLELLSIAPPGDYQVSSGIGHGLDVGVTAPELNTTK